jgi:hypothetical protein
MLYVLIFELNFYKNIIHNTHCLPLKNFKDEAAGQLRININDKS